MTAKSTCKLDQIWKSPEGGICNKCTGLQCGTQRHKHQGRPANQDIDQQLQYPVIRAQTSKGQHSPGCILQICASYQDETLNSQPHEHRGYQHQAPRSLLASSTKNCVNPVVYTVTHKTVLTQQGTPSTDNQSISTDRRYARGVGAESKAQPRMEDADF